MFSTNRSSQRLIACLVLFCTMFAMSCTKDHVTPDLPILVDNPDGFPIIEKEVDYQTTKIPDNPADLVFYHNLSKPVALSDLKDTVVVFLQGGPKHFNDTSGVHNVFTIIDGFTKGGYSFVGLQQAHYVNPTIFGSGSRFTEQNAADANKSTFEMLERTINWLKNANKTVIVFGHSNGSLVTQAYLASGRKLGDFTIVSATRLIAVPEIFTAYQSKKDFGYVNGTTFVTRDMPANELAYFNVLSKLQLDNFKNYTELLKGKPFLKRTIYLLGARDQALGALTDVEKSFLADNGIPSLTISALGGVHGAAPYGAPSAIAYIRQFK